MTEIAQVQRFKHGSHFYAYALRNESGLLNPFLGVDHVWMSGPTFPEHSHAGFSAVSYLFLDAETGYDNHDSLGTRNLIRPGGLHWLAAGHGITHEERPAQANKTVHSLQIFINLAPALQDEAPAVFSLEPEDVPVIKLPGINVRVPLGSFGDAQSPLNPPTPVSVLDISLEKSAALAVPVAPGQCAFVMPISGTTIVNGQSFTLDDLALPVFPRQTEAHEIGLQVDNGVGRVVVFMG